MVLHLLILTLASITYAQLQENHLAESACNLFKSWDQPTHLDTFVRYTLDGEDKSVSLSSECNERVQDALSICTRYSNFICSELTIVVSRSSQTTKRSHRPDIMKRSRPKQTDMSGSCASPQSSALADSSTAGQSSTSLDLSSASANEMNSATTLSLTPSSTKTESSTTLSLTLSTSPTGGLTMTASSTGAKASSSNRICVIKQADMNSKPPGKCQCSDNISINFDPLVCEVCS